MANEFEARSELLLSGWNDGEATGSYPVLDDPKAHPDLCINCGLIMQEMAKYVGPNGDETPFTSETQYVQLARFREDQHLKTQECRFCRVIQSSNPGRFVEDALYPRLALLTKRSDWELEKLWRIEFAQSSTFPSPVGTLYMVPIPDEKPVTPDITSWISHPNTLECAKAWLDNCDQNHNCCKSSDPSTPSRLISIGTKSTDLIHLVLNNDISYGTSYATLSHCWGNYKPIQLISSNLNSFLKSIDFGALPLTFQEAIITARSLGIAFIWIDSLCIIQDSPSDWEKESNEMDSVYRKSSLNIGAAAAADGRAGLFFPRPPHQQDTHSVYQIATNKFRIIDRDHWHNTVESLPLLTRAWVYQERHLAPRNLYFGKSSLAWECDSCRLSETFPFMLPSLKHQSPLPRLQPWKNQLSPSLSGHALWMNMVTAYTRTNLTFHSDKLIALSGIAHRFPYALENDTYLAGLWAGDLMNQLLWCIPSPTKFLPLSNPEEDKSSFVAPSWSWAQTSLPIKFHVQSLPKANYTLTTKSLANLLNFHLGVEWTLGKQNPGAFIVLSTQICKASLIYNTYEERCGCCPLASYNPFSSLFPNTSFAAPNEDGQGSPARFYPDFSFESHDRGFTVEDLYCLPLVETIFHFGEGRGWTWTTGLVLVRCDSDASDGREEKGAFKRWGTWQVSFDNTKGGLGLLNGAFAGFDGENLVRCKQEDGDVDGKVLYEVKMF